MVKAILCVPYWLTVFTVDVYMKHDPHPKPFKYWEVSCCTVEGRLYTGKSKLSGFNFSQVFSNFPAKVNER